MQFYYCCYVHKGGIITFFTLYEIVILKFIEILLINHTSYKNKFLIFICVIFLTKYFLSTLIFLQYNPTFSIISQHFHLYVFYPLCFSVCNEECNAFIVFISNLCGKVCKMWNFHKQAKFYLKYYAKVT